MWLYLSPEYSVNFRTGKSVRRSYSTSECPAPCKFSKGRKEESARRDGFFVCDGIVGGQSICSDYHTESCKQDVRVSR